MTALHRIVFTPSGLEGKVADGTTVLEAARAIGADLDTVCGGRGICGRCQVTPSLGRFAKWAIDARLEALGPPTTIEVDYHGSRPLAVGNRLGCAARITGDVVVDVPPTSQVHRQVVRKQLDLATVVVDPSFRLYYVVVPPAELGHVQSAAASLGAAVAEQHGLPVEPAVDRALLRTVHQVLAAQHGEVTVAVHEPLDGRPQVVAAWPGYVDAAYGIAIDVGSTTIAGHLCDLATGEVLATAGRMNPQIRFGEDLMSRVSYVMMNPGGDRELTAVVRRAIDELVGELCADAGTSRGAVLEVVIVGNPIMHHIVLGIDPTPLGSAPFVLATDEAVTGRAAELDVDAPNARWYAGACIAGHVGADTSAAILAEGPHRGERMQLLVDVGTNAEIVLGDRTGLFAASSPTGPAFEGAQISCGQRATAGAIERVRIDPDTYEPRVRVIGCDAWSDEVGFAAAVTGVCGSGIIDAIAEMVTAGIVDADGTIRGELAEQTPRVVPDGRTFAYVLHVDGGARFTITQNDVRAIQLAKAALRAGIELLLEHAGRPRLADIRLAGAFGAHIDPQRAIVLGLLPDAPVDAVRSVGNAAGAGAVTALLSRAARAEMEHVVRGVTKIETATEPRFQELFVAAMGFPHATGAPAGAAARPEQDVTARRGREARREARAAAVIERQPFLTRALAPVELLSTEGLELLEHNADTILEEVGVEVHGSPGGLDRFAAAGADVDGTRVRFPRGLARQLVSTAPASFVQHARNPANSVQIGGDATVFAPNYGSPFVHDLDRGRRYATLGDFENIVKLAYLHPHLHHSGGTVCEPVDVPVATRHLDMVYAHLRWSDKALMGSVTAGERAADSVELARLAFGGDLAGRTVLTSLVNASSPLVWDGTMLAAAEVYAAANQATIITPFILAGAMAPATSAGVVAQTLAEALAGMAFVQLVRPGAPVVLGSFASSMSMQTGAPTFGTPEPAHVLYAMAALARRLGVPFRSGGCLTASKVPDAQAAYESASTLLPTVLAGTHFVLHAAGWLEGGLAVGYEKFVLDADQLGMMATFARGIDLSENGQALDAIRSNPPGTHHLGTAHTLANFETAFYRSETADNASFEQWVEDGSLDAAWRANGIWKQRLAAYEPPPIDDAVDEAMRDFVTRRRGEIPDMYA